MKLEVLLNHPELPSLPEALITLNELIKKDRPISEITAVIEREPSLSARALELANSAWYKRQRQSNTVQDAITVIGLSSLQQLVFATSITRIFYGVDTGLADMKSFWQQSLQLACGAKSISEELGHKSAVQSFTSGLLSYLGKLIIYIYLPQESQKILSACAGQQLLQHEEERNALGFSHLEVTAGLLRKWNVPETICEPIQYYTEPAAAPQEHQRTAAVLNLSHYMVHLNNEELQNVVATYPAAADSVRILNLDKNTIPGLADSAIAQVNDAKQLIGLQD